MEICFEVDFIVCKIINGSGVWGGACPYPEKNKNNYVVNCTITHSCHYLLFGITPGLYKDVCIAWFPPWMISQCWNRVRLDIIRRTTTTTFMERSADWLSIQSKNTHIVWIVPRLCEKYPRSEWPCLYSSGYALEYIVPRLLSEIYMQRMGDVLGVVIRFRVPIEMHCAIVSN